MPILPMPSASEMDFLVDLYDSTNGTRWVWEKPYDLYGFPWNFTSGSNPCSDFWQGISCSCSNQTEAHLNSYYIYIYDDYVSNPTSTCNIVHLFLIKHNLIGTIPTSIGNLGKLRNLHLAENGIFGRIPTQLSSLPSLQILDMAQNKLTGPIPSAIGGLLNLTVIDLVLNSLTGEIPTILGALRKLQLLDLNLNDLTGSIPSTLGDLTNLYFFALEFNSLIGMIPSSLGSLSNLEFFSLDSNALTGTFPSTLGGVKGVKYFELTDNYLTGGIPSFFGSFTECRFLSLDSNGFTGTLPTSLGLLSSILQLTIHNNNLSGPIPPQLGMLSNIQQILLEYNRFTGPIPTQLGSLNQLYLLYLYNNLLTGPLPAELSRCTNLLDFEANDNFFSGTIPAEYSRLPLLTFFVSGNSISGPLSQHLFTNPTIQTLSLSSNCFTGSLPSCKSINYSQSIVTLDLSDLSSGSGCRRYPFPRWLRVGSSLGYTAYTYISGGVPGCIFSLPNLTALYLAGNGLTGSLELPEGWDCRSSLLRSVALSANQLEGSIPVEIQRCGLFTWLDLSLNRLSGSLDAGFVIRDQSAISQSSSSGTDTPMYLSLSVNRLSGRLPWTSNISSLGGSMIGNMLVGNMFAFSVSQVATATDFKEASQLSSHNGSTNLNDGLICSLIMTCLATGVYMLYLLLSDLESLRNRFVKYSQISCAHLKGYAMLVTLKAITPRLALAATLMLSGIILVVKLAFSTYSTQRHQYSWTLSVCFLHSWLPICMCMLIVCLYQLCMLHMSSVSLRLPKSLSESMWELARVDIGRYCDWKIVLTLLLNITVMMVINVVYLTIILVQGVNVSFIQFLLGLFKTGWSFLMVRLGQRLLESMGSWYWLSLFVSTFNMIVSPCITTILSDSKCLLPLFDQSTIPSSTIEYRYCSFFEVSTCSEYSVTQQQLPDLTPPFIYNYQCGSALIVNFVPVFLYFVIFSSILWPLMQLGLIIMDETNSLHISQASFASQLFPLLIIDQTLLTPNMNILHFQVMNCLSSVLVLIMISLTFGLASPYLGLVVIFGVLVRLEVNILMIHRYVYLTSYRSSSPNSSRQSELEMPRSSIESTLHITNIRKSHLISIAPSMSTPLDSVDASKIPSRTTSSSPSISLISLTVSNINTTSSSSFDLHSALSLSFVCMSVSTGLFWSFLGFDMIGDVYGSGKGILASILVSLVSIVVSMGYMMIRGYHETDREKETEAKSIRVSSMNNGDQSSNSHVTTSEIDISREDSE